MGGYCNPNSCFLTSHLSYPGLELSCLTPQCIFFLAWSWLASLVLAIDLALNSSTGEFFKPNLMAWVLDFPLLYSDFWDWCDPSSLTSVSVDREETCYNEKSPSLREIKTVSSRTVCSTAPIHSSYPLVPALLLNGFVMMGKSCGWYACWSVEWVHWASWVHGSF